MSSPILWGPTGALSLQSALLLPGSTSGFLTLQTSAATTSYSIIFPAAQASGASALVNDGSGNGSWLNYTSTVTNSVLVSRDSNGNSGFNNSSVSVQTVVSAGQTITMTAGSTGRQRITGTSSVTFNLPDCTTLLNGWPFYFNNTSSSSCTVNRQDGVTLVATLPANSITYIACMDNSTVQGVWAATPWLTPTATSGSAGTTLPGSLGLNGTSSGTFTFNPAATTTTYSVTLPSAQGTGALTNNGSGALSWAAAGGLSLSAVGASPNANAATLTGSALNLQPFDGTHPGVVTASGGGSTNFLRADGSWAAPAGTGPLTTKGDIFTFSTVNARQPVPGDYGDLIADSTTATGWRAASYVQTNGRPDKNYIQYADFENNSTTGWTLGTIGTLVNGLPTGSPTFGSGASGNLSIATVNTNIIAGAFSLAYASSAATTQGNMVASSSYAIDAEDQAKILQIKFAYSIPTGVANANFSGTSSNSYAWAIWDVTNSAWLTSAGNFNLVQNSGVGIATGTCQTNSTTANIRLVVYNANATSGAATLNLDDFFVGPQIVQKGPAMSDWAAYTPTFTNFGTVTGINVNWRRVGDSMEILGNFTVGTVVASVASISLPSNFSIDTTKLTANNTTSTAGNGIGSYYTNAVSSSLGALITAPATSTTLFYISGTSGTNTSNTGLTPANGNVLNSSTVVNIHALIPIAGWSSNSVQSSDTDTRVVAALVTGTPASAGSASIIIFPTVVKDTTGSYNATTGQYTASVTGFYQIQGLVNTSGYAAGQSVYAYIAGVQNIQLGVEAITNFPFPFTGEVYLNAGQTLDVRTTASMTSMNACNIAITRASGPAVITATDSVNARYFASSTSLSGSLATINWTTKDFDSANGMSSGTYTVPVSGKYQVNSAILVSGTVALNSTLIMEIQKNGTVVSRYTEYAGGVETNLKGIVTDIISCLAGDTLRIQVSTSASGPAIVSSNFDNYMSLSRVGN